MKQFVGVKLEPSQVIELDQLAGQMGMTRSRCVRWLLAEALAAREGGDEVAKAARWLQARRAR
jgi:hypothetical protein